MTHRALAQRSLDREFASRRAWLALNRFGRRALRQVKVIGAIALILLVAVAGDRTLMSDPMTSAAAQSPVPELIAQSTPEAQTAPLLQPSWLLRSSLTHHRATASRLSLQSVHSQQSSKKWQVSLNRGMKAVKPKDA